MSRNCGCNKSNKVKNLTKYTVKYDTNNTAKYVVNKDGNKEVNKELKKQEKKKEVNKELKKEQKKEQIKYAIKHKQNSSPKVYEAYHKKYSSFKHLTSDELRSWDNIHIRARNAITDDLRKEFENYIEYLTYTFPCPKCRPHIKSYLSSHSIKRQSKVENGKNVGIAKWSWEFHNDVNKRLKKPIMSWDIFSAKYLNLF